MKGKYARSRATMQQVVRVDAVPLDQGFWQGHPALREVARQLVQRAGVAESDAGGNGHLVRSGLVKTTRGKCKEPAIDFRMMGADGRLVREQFAVQFEGARVDQAEDQAIGQAMPGDHAAHLISDRVAAWAVGDWPRKLLPPPLQADFTEHRFADFVGNGSEFRSECGNRKEIVPDSARGEKRGDIAVAIASGGGETHGFGTICLLIRHPNSTREVPFFPFSHREKVARSAG